MHIAKEKSTFGWKLEHLQQCWSEWELEKDFSALCSSSWSHSSLGSVWLSINKPCCGMLEYLVDSIEAVATSLKLSRTEVYFQFVSV